MSRKLIITIKGRNVEFTTQYDKVSDLLTRVGELIAAGRLKGDFILSLYSQRERGLSTKQLLWLHYYVAQVEDVAKPPVGETLDFVKIVAMLHFARDEGKLKWPKLRVQTETGRCVKLGLAGAQSTAPGAINVIDDDGRVFLGRIPKNGKIAADRLPQDVIAALVEVCKNPDEAARLYGKRTGHCCYCGHILDNYNSIELGYGPICAERWGRFHSYVKGAVEGAYDHPTPSEIQEAAK